MERKYSRRSFLRIISKAPIMIGATQIINTPYVLARASAYIGIIGLYSGPLGRNEQRFFEAAQLATQVINTESRGIKLRAIPVDVGGKYEEIPYKIHSARKKGCIAFIGPYTSTEAYLTCKAIDKYEVPLLLGTPLTRYDKRTYSNIFNLYSGIFHRSKVLIEYLKSNDKKGKTRNRIGVMGGNTDQELDSMKTFNKIAKNQELNVHIYTPFHFSAINDFTPYIQKLIYNRIDKLILFSQLRDTIKLIKQLNRSFPRYRPSVIWSPPSLYNDIDMNEIISDIITLKPASHLLPTKQEERANYIFKKKFKSNIDMISAFYWGSLWLLKNIINKCGISEPGCLIRELYKTNLTPNDKGILVPGGVKFNKYGYNIRHMPLLVQITSKKEQIIWPPKYIIAY